jgi:hypothetical protein
MSDCEIIAELERHYEKHRGSGTSLEHVLKGAIDALTRLLITKKEREAIAFAADHFRQFKIRAATLRKLLERLA